MESIESRELPGAPNEIRITRVLDAPRAKVWAAMTDPLQLVHWWGPNGFTTTIHAMEVRAGGLWKHTMHGPDGSDYPNSCVFNEVVAPERIVYAHGDGRAGGPGAHFVATWTFEDLGNNRTRLTCSLVFDSAQERELLTHEYGVVEGGKQTLQRLAAFLPCVLRQPA